MSYFMDRGETIKFKPIPKKPNLEMYKNLDRCDNISLFIPFHKHLAAELTTMLMNIHDLEEFFATAAYCRDQINCKLFVYSFSVALLHRSDTHNLRMPPYAQIFPDKFVDSNIFPIIYEKGFMDQMEESEALEMDTLEEKAKEMKVSKVSVKQNYMATSNDLEPENRLAYFREDLGVNLHHVHWHLVYPSEGKKEIVDKDRRGELFYYMHQQIVARYEFERMCNQLPRVRRLTNLKEPIEEGYFPKLINAASNNFFAARPSGAILKDVEQIRDAKNKLAFDIYDLERWKTRIYDAIHSNFVQMPDGTTSKLDIDTLGNMLEAVSALSPNFKYYGDLHNLGHMAIALCHDPDHRHLEPEGVMGDTATAMRDPIFYRWHALINDMCVAFKNTLLPYTEQELNYKDIHVTSLELITPKAGNKNIIQTFWQELELELSRGVNFMVNRSVVGKFTRLQHARFQYRFKVQNTSNGARMGTVRIFLAPKFDERVQGDGSDVIEFERESTASTVTIPLERTFQDLENPDKSDGGVTSEKRDSFCGCGWPENMLVPKGNVEGFECVLFVMVSNYEDDKVQQSTGDECSGSPYCGVRDKLYPDRRSMGFPFDRLPKDGVTTLEEFLTPNMTTVDVKIRFTNSMQ
ncbi:hypothetical protein B566_EDAN013190 [Ephemera danica]|nr:hypothetical protein B566_EDAN013190 [Ephemera danica]